MIDLMILRLRGNTFAGVHGILVAETAQGHCKVSRTCQMLLEAVAGGQNHCGLASIESMWHVSLGRSNEVVELDHQSVIAPMSRYSEQLSILTADVCMTL